MRSLCSPRFTIMASFCLPSGFLSSCRTTDCKHAWYVHVIWEGYYNSDPISLPSFLSFAWLTISAWWWETNVSARSIALWCGRLPYDAEGARLFQAITLSRDIHPNLQSWSQLLEIFILYAFWPSHLGAMWAKHFDLTQVCIKLFSNIGRGNGGAGTYSIGITVMSSYFYHFPKQFVYGCLSFLIF